MKENPNINYIHDNECRTAQVAFDNELYKTFIIFGGECKLDGDSFGAIIGGLPEGCAAFADTRSEAILKCMNNFSSESAREIYKKKLEDR